MDRRYHLGLGMTGIAGLCLGSGLFPAHAAPQPATLAVASFDYVDTSGEVVDQTTAHARRLKTFAEDLRHDLGNSGKLRILSLDCPTPGCSASNTEPANLIAAAEKAGAAYLLIGGVHKLSTLIEWSKVEILDVRTGQVVFDRLLTFRGDDDESWRRAEQFLAREILTRDTLH